MAAFLTPSGNQGDSNRTRDRLKYSSCIIGNVSTKSPGVPLVLTNNMSTLIFYNIHATVIRETMTIRQHHFVSDSVANSKLHTDESHILPILTTYPYVPSEGLELQSQSRGYSKSAYIIGHKFEAIQLGSLTSSSISTSIISNRYCLPPANTHIHFLSINQSTNICFHGYMSYVSPLA